MELNPEKKANQASESTSQRAVNQLRTKWGTEAMLAGSLVQGGS